MTASSAEVRRKVTIRDGSAPRSTASTLLQLFDVIAGFRLSCPRGNLLVGHGHAVDRLVRIHANSVIRNRGRGDLVGIPPSTGPSPDGKRVVCGLRRRQVPTR